MARRKKKHGNQHLKVYRLKQTRNGKEYWSRGWYGRRRHRRHSYYFPLGTDEKEALIQWKQIYMEIQSKQVPFEEILLKYLPGYAGRKESRRPSQHIPAHDFTIEDYLQFVWAHLSSLDMKPETLKEYEVSLLRLIGVGLAQQAGRPNPTVRLSDKEKQRLRRRPLTILNRSLVTHYKTATVEAAEEEGRSTISARRSANSYLKQARSLFSKQIRGLAEDSGIKLPNLTSFLEAEGFRKVKVRYILPNDKLIKKTFEHLSDPEKAPPRDIYIAVLLALFGGLRKKEVPLVGPDSLTKSNDKPGINIPDKTKNKLPRFNALQARVFEFLKSAFPEGSEFFIQGTMTYRTDDLFDEASAWLRNLGWKVNKPFHELRKLVGSMIATTQGMQAAQKFLDHESIRTTEEYYADITMSEEIAALWEEFEPVLPKPAWKISGV